MNVTLYIHMSQPEFELFSFSLVPFTMDANQAGCSRQSHRANQDSMPHATSSQRRIIHDERGNGRNTMPVPMRSSGQPIRHSRPSEPHVHGKSRQSNSAPVLSLNSDKREDPRRLSIAERSMATHDEIHPLAATSSMRSETPLGIDRPSATGQTPRMMDTAITVDHESDKPRHRESATKNTAIDVPSTFRRTAHVSRRQMCVFLVFLVFLLLGIGIFLSWPRTPLVRIDGASLTRPTQITNEQRNFAFESGWQVQATFDSRRNYVPLRIKTDALIKDALTGSVIGRQHQQEWVTVPPGTLSTVQIPVDIDYEARVPTDTTWNTLVDACTTDKNALQLQFWITLHIAFLDWLGYRPKIIALPSTGGLACPT